MERFSIQRIIRHARLAIPPAEHAQGLQHSALRAPTISLLLRALALHRVLQTPSLPLGHASLAIQTAQRALVGRLISARHVLQIDRFSQAGGVSQLVAKTNSSTRLARHARAAMAHARAAAAPEALTASVVRIAIASFAVEHA